MCALQQCTLPSCGSAVSAAPVLYRHADVSYSLKLLLPGDGCLAALNTAQDKRKGLRVAVGAGDKQGLP